MRLFDSHCHLHDERIAARAPEMIARAREAGVVFMLCCGSRESDWEAVRNLAASNPGVVPAFGIHPWYVASCSNRWIVKLEAFLAAIPGAAVGEIGLDHAHGERNDREQEAVFTAQLELAAAFRRPLSIHCRGAWGDMLRILEKRRGAPYGGAIHSYSGSPDLIRPLEALGLSFSFSGSITYDRNRRGRACATAVPEGRLLIETDSPDIPPLGVERESNEPAFLVAIAKTIAQLRGKPVEETAEITYRNAAEVFRKG